MRSPYGISRLTHLLDTCFRLFISDTAIVQWWFYDNVCFNLLHGFVSGRYRMFRSAIQDARWLWLRCMNL